jgi:LAGLIDADG endonuclease
MKQTKEIKLAYMAGFFDGEGCITIVRQKPNGRGKTMRHQLHVIIGQKDGAIMDWIVGNFGGPTHLVKRDGSYSWQLSQNKAYYFLKQILPFLKYKRSQAELGIRFMQRLINKEATFASGKGGRLSERELAIRENLCVQMKELKNKVNSYSKNNLEGAGVTTKCEEPQIEVCDSLTLHE